MENAVSYLTILLNDLEQVKNSLSAYNNTILIIKANHFDPVENNPEDENLYKRLSRKMTEEEKNMLITTISYFRTYSTRAFIGYTSIAPKLKSDKKAIIESTYNKIKTEVMPDYDTAEGFVQALNDIFVNEINVQALINTAQKTADLSRLSASPTLV